MGQFTQLTEYKNNIGLKLITNENLVKALINTNTDFLNQSLPDGFKPTDLLHNRIYPYIFIPGVESDPKNFITMSFGKYDYVNNVFKSGILSFYIICHFSLLKTDYGLRYDYIFDQIDSMFNKESDVGVFDLTIDSGGDLPIISDNYFGSKISYKFYDFQKS